jgi:hypothetical protein
MKRGVGVFVCLSLILVLSLTFISANIFNDIFKGLTGKVTDTDLTPRIAYWFGKINQHVENGVWVTDPDGSSGANIDRLTYCQKWYPHTISVVEYKNETITSWTDIGNVNSYTSTKQSYKCIQANYSCIDSDKGVNYSVKGEVTTYLNGGIQYYLDYCNDAAILNESYCEENIASTVIRDCGMEGKVCSDGACVEEQIVAECGNGIQDIGEQCDGNARAISASCQYFGYASGTLGCKSDCTFNFSDCVGTGQAYTCTDSDGGLNYFVWGNASLVNAVNFINDSCIDKNYLMEGYCPSEGGLVAGQQHFCENGCVNGACVEESNGESCSVDVTGCDLEWKVPVCGVVVSSADGLEELCEIPGNASGSISSGFSFDNTFSCVETNLCPYGCVDGACIEEECSSDPDCEKDHECIANVCVDIEEASCEEGCSINNKCVDVCYRTSDSYCSLNGEVVAQQAENTLCYNGCECESNLCLNGQCVSGTLFQKILNWFTNIFG